MKPKPLNYKETLITVRQLAQQCLFRRLNDYVVVNDRDATKGTLYLVCRRNKAGKWKLQTSAQP